MADPITPAVAPATTPAATTAPVVAPQANGGDEELKFSKDAFAKRLEQAQRSAEMKALKALGFDSLEAAAEFKAAAEKASQDAAEKRKAEMDELTRLKTEIAERDKAIEAERARAREAKERADVAESEARLARLFAERGIKGTGADYAEFRLGRAAIAAKEKSELFVEADFLDALVKDPVEAVRLGITAPTAPVATPASTMNTAKGPLPKTPAPTGEFKHALQMTDAEWQAWKNNPTL